jgi:hypothetical protein
VVSVPAGALCLALPIVLPRRYGLVLTVADRECDGGIVYEEAIHLPRPGGCCDPAVPEGGDVAMEIPCILEGERKNPLRFIEPPPLG